MGNTRSQLRKLNRRNSFTTLYKKTTQSRSHSLASNTTGGSDLSDPLGDLKIPPADLSSDQLALVKVSWHLVSVDTSNVCLNFLHQLERRFPRFKRIKSINVSTPSLPLSLQLMSRNQSCTSAYTTNGQLSRQALKLACCLDAIIGSLMRNGTKVKEEKLLMMLSENGYQFKRFLGFDTFYSDAVIVKEMTHAFCESLRLILTHNGANWGEELQEAWELLFCILLYHLDGLSEDEMESMEMQPINHSMNWGMN